jgi:Cdc6-like AAA superfamily ATPase
MPDPLSIAASVAGLVAISETIFHSVISYGKQVKHAPIEVSRLAMRISELSGVLHSLRLLVTQFSVEKAKTLLKVETIRECQALLDQIRERLAAMEQTKGKGTKDAIKYAIKRLTWPFTLPETEKLVSRVEQFKSDFNFALTRENTAAIFDVQNSQHTMGRDIQEIRGELNRRQEIENRVLMDQKSKKVLDFYDKATSAAIHDISRKLRHPGTGFWFTKGKIFAEWLTSTNENLWLYGIPGAGKTVLASSLIETTLDNAKDNQAVAYFYCDYRDSAKQNMAKILGSLIAQISLQRDQAFDILHNHYENFTNGGKKDSDPDVDDLIPLISLLIATFSQTSIIIDGLDECEDNVADVLDSWLRVVKECQGALRTIVLSREDHVIRKRLTQENFHAVAIEAQTGDLRLYVASEIEKRCRTGKLYLDDADIKADIMEQLVEKAHGM